MLEFAGYSGLRKACGRKLTTDSNITFGIAFIIFSRKRSMFLKIYILTMFLAKALNNINLECQVICRNVAP